MSRSCRIHSVDYDLWTYSTVTGSQVDGSEFILSFMQLSECLCDAHFVLCTLRSRDRYARRCQPARKVQICR